jgi:hypothetical protein
MSVADSLVAELSTLRDLAREFLLAEIARDYGEGFARLMREELAKRERTNGRQKR